MLGLGNYAPSFPKAYGKIKGKRWKKLRGAMEKARRKDAGLDA